MSYNSQNVSYNRVNYFREDGSSFMVMAYKQSELITHYEIYPASLKYNRWGKNGEDSTYYPVYSHNRYGCLREDTFSRLLRDGVIVDKTPSHTKDCYRFFTFPEEEIKLYGGVFAD